MSRRDRLLFNKTTQSTHQLNIRPPLWLMSLGNRSQVNQDNRALQFARGTMTLPSFQPCGPSFSRKLELINSIPVISFLRWCFRRLYEWAAVTESSECGSVRRNVDDRGCAWWENCWSWWVSDCTFKISTLGSEMKQAEEWRDPWCCVHPLVVNKTFV